MDSSVPRLRLNRQSAMQPSIFDSLAQDAESLNSSPPSTPKATPKQKLSGLPLMGHLDDSVQGDEERRPADMLRSLLGRSRPSGPNHPMTPVDSDSDFDGPSPPFSRSIASQSVKDLFQRAIREPGDTPDKRQRRNSFDSGSSVRMGPTIRRSASDEEDSGGGALRSSQATTFDILRGKLDLPSSVISESITSSIPKRIPQGQDLQDLVRAAEEMNLSSPERASHRSDTEESDATKDWTAKRPSRIPRSTPEFKFPDTSRTRTNSNPGRYTPSSPTANRYSTSTSPTTASRLPLARPGSSTSHSSVPRPRTVSSTSTASSHSEEGPEELHERERNWNSPRPRWDSHSSQESKAKEREERNRETEKWVRPRTQSNNAIPVRSSPGPAKKAPSSPSPSPRAAYPRSNSVTSRTSATKPGALLTERMSPFALGGSPSPSRDKGHKRATAQLTNANGPVPPTLPSDDEGSVFSTTPSLEPATSTPVTGNGRALPPAAPDSPASDAPLPPSPPSPPSRPQSALDSERLSKAMASSTSRPQPPPSPPRSRSPSVRDSRTPSPPSPQLYDKGRDIISTPPRAGKARQVFDTPSPPPGMPRLPDSPTDEDTVEQMRLSAGLGHRREAAERMPSMLEPKTPRPPGAWATPGQTPRYVDDVTPDNMVSMTTFGGVTPAPPGGWMATPGSAKRKGILKVRFDEQAAAAAALAAAGDNSEVKLDDIEEEEEKPKRSNVRLVDAYGRERVFGADGREVDLGEPGSPTRPHMKRQDVGSPPRKPVFRVVDALGREMDEASMRLAAGVNGNANAGSPVVDDLVNGINGSIKEESEESDLDEENVPKSLAAKLRKITGDLYHDLDLELDKPDAFPSTVEKLRGDELMDLAQSSRTSRIERMKLNKKLELVKATDEGVYKTMKDLRGLVKTSPVSLFRQAREAQGLTKGLIWAIILAQLLFLAIMYSYAQDLARRFFITAHYDPFYPALYDSSRRQFVNNNFNGAIPSSIPHSWNVFAVPESTRRVGVWGVLNSVGEQARQLVTGDRKWSASVGRVGGRTWPPS